MPHELLLLLRLASLAATTVLTSRVAFSRQRALMFLMIPLTALFGVTSCFYHGKLASSGKNAALAGQGGGEGCPSPERYVALANSAAVSNAINATARFACLQPWLKLADSHSTP